jgi:hypothetical protein
VTAGAADVECGNSLLTQEAGQLSHQLEVDVVSFGHDLAVTSFKERFARDLNDVLHARYTRTSGLSDNRPGRSQA